MLLGSRGHSWSPLGLSHSLSLSHSPFLYMAISMCVILCTAGILGLSNVHFECFFLSFLSSINVKDNVLCRIHQFNHTQSIAVSKNLLKFLFPLVYELDMMPEREYTLMRCIVTSDMLLPLVDTLPTDKPILLSLMNPLDNH